MTHRRRPPRTRATDLARWGLLLVALLIAACDDAPSATPTPDASLDARALADVSRDAPIDVRRWGCPAGWVAYERGGCGPAVLLCAPDGGAAPGTCDDLDLRRPAMFPDGDGGVSAGLALDERGRITGAWREPGSPDGPPAMDWRPSRVPADTDGGTALPPGIPRCLPGWTRTADGLCDPDLPTDCPAGTGPLPAGGCTRTGARECPDAPYAARPAESIGARAVYVRAGADPAAADGSEEHPFATIAAGIQGAGAGGWVFIAAGNYNENPRVTGTAHLLGVCADRVTITGVGTTRRTVQVSGANGVIDLRGVTLRGMGFAAITGAHASLMSVRVESVSELGVQLNGVGTEATVTDLFVRGVTVAASTVGYGVSVDAGARLTASRVHVTDTVNGAVVTTGTSSIELDGVVLRAVRSELVEGQGNGVTAQGGATAQVRNALIEDALAGGFANLGSTLRVSDAVIRNLRASPYTTGLSARGPSALTAERVRVEDVARRGLGAFEGATFTFRDGVVRRVRSPSAGVSGYCAEASGSTMQLSGSVLEDCEVVGAYATGAQARLTLADSVVRQTLAQTADSHGVQAQSQGRITVRASRIEGPFAAGAFGTLDGALALDGTLIVPSRTNGRASGVWLERAASASLSRVHLAGGAPKGLYVGTDTRVVADGLAITGTRTPPDSEPDLGGRALDIEQRATFTASGLWITDTEGTGLFMADRATATVRGMAVRDTRSSVSGDGLAVRVQSGSRIDARGVDIESCEGAAILLTQQGSSARLDDVIVRGVRANATGQGFGLVGYVGPTIEAHRVAVVDSASAAVSAAYSVGRGDYVTRINASDLFVRGVRLGGAALHPGEMAPYDYGLQSATGSVVNCDRAVLDDGGWGFYRAAGELRLRQAVITRQREAAGASNGAAGSLPLELEDVQAWGNARDEVQYDVMLPEVRVEVPDLRP